MKTEQKGDHIVIKFIIIFLLDVLQQLVVSTIKATRGYGLGTTLTGLIQKPKDGGIRALGGYKKLFGNP